MHSFHQNSWHYYYKSPSVTEQSRQQKKKKIIIHFNSIHSFWLIFFLYQSWVDLLLYLMIDNISLKTTINFKTHTNFAVTLLTHQILLSTYIIGRQVYYNPKTKKIYPKLYLWISLIKPITVCTYVCISLIIIIRCLYKIVNAIK